MILVGAFALAGCDGADSGSGSPGPGQPPAGVDNEVPIVTISYQEMVAELQEHAATLPLPPGAEWPPPPAEPEPQPDAEGVLRGTVYEQGVGKSIAEKAWWCAWAREWLQQRGVDDDRAETALTTLHTVADTTYYQTMDSYTQESVEGMLEAANLGDPTLIANDVDLNCQQ